MTNNDLAITIRLALLDLRRDPYIKLPKKKADLQKMLNGLREEQKADPESKWKQRTQA